MRQMRPTSMASFIALGIAATLLAGCTDREGARETLLDAGYSDIQVGGYDGWACGKDDTYSTRFTATGPTGRRVSGTVCSGVFKGDTIRLKRVRQ